MWFEVNNKINYIIIFFVIIIFIIYFKPHNWLKLMNISHGTKLTVNKQIFKKQKFEAAQFVGITIVTNFIDKCGRSCVRL